MNQKQNLKQLLALAQEYDDMRDVFREFTGEPLAGIAERIGVRRTDLNLMLEPGASRSYLHVRRLLEAVYDLPAYSLDTILGGENGGQGSRDQDYYAE